MRSQTRKLGPLVALVSVAACQVYDPALLDGRSTSVGGSSGTEGDGVSSTTSTSASDTATSSPGDASNSTTTTVGASATTTTGSGGSNGDGTTVTGTGGASNDASDNSSSTTGVGGTVGNDCEYVDCCPNDPNKFEPGQCGCEIADTDSDEDGVADCIDGCPEDASKSEPGICGCGLPDADTGGAVSCTPLVENLVHRYSFEGTGTTIHDAGGRADGTLVGTTLDASGTLVLSDTGSEQYVDLPNGLLSTLENATLEFWFVWDGGPMWTRLFDIGDTVEGVEGDPGTGQTFVLFTPRGPDGPDYPYVTFHNGDLDTEAKCSGSEPVTTGTTHHLVLSLDSDNDVLSLYLDGELTCSTPMVNDLNTLNDVNSWIGRSQFSSDGPFSGSIDEFRVYDFALTEEHALLSFEQGPNPAFLDQ